MGPQSQRTLPPNTAAKRRAGRAHHPYQHLQHGLASPTSICKRCNIGSSYHGGHAELCPKSQKHKKKLRDMELARVQQNNQQLYSNLFQRPINNINPPTIPVPNNINNVTDTNETSTTQNPPKRQAFLPGATPVKDLQLSSHSLKKVIKENMKKVTDEFGGVPDKKTVGCRPPFQIQAVIHHLLNDLLPNNYQSKSNALKPGPMAKERTEWLSRHLESTGGIPCFTVPKQDVRYTPDSDYAVAEGVKIYVARWELVWDGLTFDCPNPACRCKGEGNLIHERHPFLSNKGLAIPLINFDRENPVNWIVPMRLV